MNYRRPFKFPSHVLFIAGLSTSILLFLFSFLAITAAIPQSHGWLGISEHIKERAEVGDALVRTPALPVTRYIFTAQVITTNATHISILSGERLMPGEVVSIVHLTFEGGSGPVYLAARKVPR
ncbi:MAG: hypothetical protein G01um101472_239 [Parcubacteria group bacterium Gr01-1014_72]|nr:MAG: hypothetical protein G01um101472_239 [Parcubacteria group bacterium Gr01-1014_72]